MGYDEAFKNVIISSRAKLSLQDNHLVIAGNDEVAKLYIKDLHCVVLESHQITITQALLSALAESKVLVLTCDRTHVINGVFTPFLGHFANAQVAREQIAVSTESKARLWQQIVQNKIANQTSVLQSCGYITEAAELARMCEKVEADDASNIEAKAAALYFKTLFGIGFSRKAKHKIHNALLDYGYAIVRSCVIRSVCMSGLLTWSGIKHSNQFNQFNLCDDIIEVFRPFVDRCVLGLLESRGKDGDYTVVRDLSELDSKSYLETMTKGDKRALIENLQSEAKVGEQIFPLSRAINHYVQRFKNALLYGQPLVVVCME